MVTYFSKNARTGWLRDVSSKGPRCINALRGADVLDMMNVKDAGFGGTSRR